MGGGRRTAHIAEVNGVLYAAFPSEKQAFRRDLSQLAAPFRERQYRIPAAQTRHVEELIAKHYPDWAIKKWTWGPWVSLPPWVRLGVNLAAAERYILPLEEGGARFIEEDQLDGSLHLHAQNGKNRACLIFDGGAFLHACLAHHEGPKAGFEEALEYLETGMYIFNWEEG